VSEEADVIEVRESEDQRDRDSIYNERVPNCLLPWVNMQFRCFVELTIAFDLGKQQKFRDSRERDPCT
jgi:hypothetical protein